MNVLMCRRLISALYQVKIEANIEADKQHRDRQPFPEFIPDQFMVLYGIKSLAIKNINEFLYGVRAERYCRDEKKNLTESEPLLMPFWKGCWHGVPLEERTPNEEFEFYIDMLAGLAKTVGEEHTLQLKSIGAFWNMLGSMTQISVPVFVCLNTIKRMFEKSHKDLHDRLHRMTLQAATQNQKAKAKIKDENDLPFPNYKRQYLGDANIDSRGHLTMYQFLDLSLQGMLKQRDKDAEILTGIYQTWVKAAGGEESFDVFAECIMNASPELPEKELFALYQTATSGENPDVPNFKLIEGILRRRKIEIKRKGGLEHVEARSIDDLKTMSTVTTLFGGKKKGFASVAALKEEIVQGKEEPKGTWGKAMKTVKAISGANSLIRMIMMPDEDEEQPPDAEPATS